MLDKATPPEVLAKAPWHNDSVQSCRASAENVQTLGESLKGFQEEPVPLKPRVLLSATRRLTKTSLRTENP